MQHGCLATSIRAALGQYWWTRVLFYPIFLSEIRIQFDKTKFRKLMSQNKKSLKAIATGSGIGSGLGIALGLGIGAATGSFVLWLIVGLAIGNGLGTALGAASVFSGSGSD